MKKKLIEKLPYPRIPAGVTGVVAIVRQPEKDFVVVDYVNVDTHVNFLRLGLRKWEYANYITRTGTWNATFIYDVHLESYRNLQNVKIVSGKSYLKKMFGTIDIWGIENTIRWRQLEKREKSRREKLQDRCSKILPLSDSEKEWLYRRIKPYHFAFYKRKGRKVKVACSACGKNHEYYLSNQDLSLEEIVNSIEVPEHNTYGDCPLCGTRIMWKAAGKAKGVYEEKDRRYLIHPYEDTAVIRYFETFKYIRGNEEYAQEEMHLEEVSRIFFLEKGKQKDYQVYNNFTGVEGWQDRNLYGMANITCRAGKTYRGNLDMLKDTKFKYAPIREYLLMNDYANIEDYMTAFLEMPFIEMLQKLHATKLTKDLIERAGWVSTYERFDKKEKSGPAILKITKERFNRLINKNLGWNWLLLFQYEKEKGVRFSDLELQMFIGSNSSATEIELLNRYTTVVKATNYLKKQHNTLGYYLDYLSLCEKNNRNLTDPHKLYPVNLEQAHNRELIYKDRNKVKAEIEERNKKNPNIKKDAAGYNRKYMYQNKDYIIRAPKDAGEIYMEGMILDHCVGRAGYIENMNRRETVILFLRRKKAKGEPYYTVEIRNGEIKQAYGKGDKKPDWEAVKEFLDAFAKVKLMKKEERKVG